MGAVDLVIQVESPKSVARGLQRIGRAGHELGAVSKGRIFPKFRADLLESAVVARAMRAGEIEETQIPRNPLDVLAQQIVAIVGRRGDRGRRPARARPRAPIRSPTSRARSSRTCSTCSPAATPPTSSPSCARGSSGTAPAARSAPARARGGSRSRTPARSPTAACSASSSSTAAAASASSTRRWSTRRAPARRSCSARRPGGSRRSRATACSSRRRRACPARCRSGRARASGGPTSSAQKIGAASRELGALGDDGRSHAACATSTRSTSARRATCSPSCATRPTRPAPLPSDRTIVVERFRDEIGDWRVCILSPFGGRVHAPWAMAITARLRESLGVDGAVDLVGRRDRAPLPRRRRAAARDELLLDPDEVEDLVVAELGDTALFGARFRENAARSLLIPRRRPGERTPLWQQRLKAQSLLQVARQLRLVPGRARDLPRVPPGRLRPAGAAARCCRASRRGRSTSSRSRRRAPRRTARRSSSTTSRRTCTRTTRRRPSGARRRSRSTATCCASCSARRSCATCSTPDAVARGRAAAARRAADARPAARQAAAARRPAAPASTTRRCAEPLVAERRAVRVRVAGEERLIAAEDAGRYRDALGVMPPSGLPDAFLEGGPESLRQLVAALRARARPVHDRAGERALRPRRDGDPRRARARGAARARRAAARRQRARVVRSRRAATAAARVARGAAARGRAGRARGARALPPVVARDRPARDRCARRSCRSRRLRCRSRSGRASCCRAACRATGPSISTRSARPARWCGSAPASTASPSTSARTPRRSARSRGAAARGRAARAIRAALERRRGLLARPARGDGPRRRRGAAGAVGSRLGGRGDERRVDAAARRPSLRRAEARAPAAAVLALAASSVVTATQGRWSPYGAALRRARPTGARSPSCCSSGRGS